MEDARFKFRCIACGKKLSARRNQVGRKARCKKCGEVLEIPHPNDVATEAGMVGPAGREETPAGKPEEQPVPEDEETPVAGDLPEDPYAALDFTGGGEPVEGREGGGGPSAGGAAAARPGSGSAGAGPGGAVFSTAPAAQPAAAAASQPIWRRAGGYLLDFLLFRWNLTPPCGSVLWVFASVAVAVIWGLLALRALTRDVVHFGAAVLALLVWLIAVRVLWELLLVPHKVNDGATDLSRRMEGREAGGRRGSTGRLVADVLLLRSHAALYVLTAFWVLGSLLIVFMPHLLAVASLGLPGGAPVLIVAFFLLWRVVCEGLACMLRTSETFSELRRRKDFSTIRPSAAGFFTFRFMVAPWIIRGLWFLGLAGITAGFIYEAVVMAGSGPAQMIVLLFLFYLLGLMVWRIFCDLVIALHTLYENAGGFQQHIHERCGGSAPPAVARRNAPLLFRHMITPGFCTAGWWVGNVVILGWAGYLISQGFLSGPGMAVLVGIALLGLVLWRVLCENLAALVRVHQSLQGAYATLKGDRRVSGGSWPADLLTFRANIMPNMLQIAWVVGVVLCAVGVVLLIGGVGTFAEWMGEFVPGIPGSGYAGLVLGGFVGLGLGLLLFRVWCEVMVAPFCINTTLSRFRRLLAETREGRPQGFVAGLAEEFGLGGRDAGSRAAAGGLAFGMGVGVLVVLVGLSTAVSAFVTGGPAFRSDRLSSMFSGPGGGRGSGGSVWDWGGGGSSRRQGGSAGPSLDPISEDVRRVVEQARRARRDGRLAESRRLLREKQSEVRDSANSRELNALHDELVTTEGRLRELFGGRSLPDVLDSDLVQRLREYRAAEQEGRRLEQQQEWQEAAAAYERAKKIGDGLMQPPPSYSALPQRITNLRRRAEHQREQERLAQEFKTVRSRLLTAARSEEWNEAIQACSRAVDAAGKLDEPPAGYQDLQELLPELRNRLAHEKEQERLLEQYRDLRARAAEYMDGTQWDEAQRTLHEAVKTGRRLDEKPPGLSQAESDLQAALDRCLPAVPGWADLSITQKRGAVNLDVPPTLTVQPGEADELRFVLVPPGEFMMGAPPPGDGSGTQQRASQPQIAGMGGMSTGMFGPSVAGSGGDEEIRDLLENLKAAEEESGASGPMGEFERNDPALKTDGAKHARPIHQVRITEPVYMAVREVTAGQYHEVVGTWEGTTKTDHPVVKVSWEEASRFCRRLSSETGKTVRLPTEAEWEYACSCGGEVRAIPKWHLDRIAWHRESFPGRPTPRPTGQKEPNKWGLKDMLGNVAEWCSDYYSPRYYQVSPDRDPQGPSAGTTRVVRGGSANDSGVTLRPYSRYWAQPGMESSWIGFRVVIEPPVQ